MKRIHMLSCLMGIGVAVVVLVASGFDGVGLGTAAVFLMCPLMMFGMMFFMMRGEHGGHRDEHTARHERDHQTAT
jgi:hypothetical protein